MLLEDERQLRTFHDPGYRPIVINMEGALHVTGGVKRPAEFLSQVLGLRDHGMKAVPTPANSETIWD